jgi:hypothetical protein
VNQLTSPHGSIELAITALLVVLGYRLIRPARAREWIGIAAFAAGLAAQLLGCSGLLRGTVLAVGLWQRVLGAVALVAGLVLAGTPARARRRTPARAAAAPANALAAGHAGLALVVAGQFLRGPSTSGLIPVAVATAVNAALAFVARRPSKPEARPSRRLPGHRR